MTYLKLAKEYWTSGNNILFLDHNDHNHKLWLAGCNSNKKSGIYSPETILGDPHDLNLNLILDETVISFKSYYRTMYILTSRKRLIVFRAESRGSYYISDENYIDHYAIAYNQTVDNSQQLALLNTTFEQESVDESIPPLSESQLGTNSEHLFERSDQIEQIEQNSPKGWCLLSLEDFSRLRGQARNDYIERTRESINNCIGDVNSWTQSEEKLSLALRQIETPDPNDTIACEHIHHHIKSLPWHLIDSNYRKSIYYDVDGIVHGPYRVIFKIGTRFIVDIIHPEHTTDETCNSRLKNLPLTRIQMSPNSYIICEACLPAHDEYRFIEHFLYLRKDAMNYLIFPMSGKNNDSIQWIQFTNPHSNFNPEIIRWRRWDNLIYFINDGILWLHESSINAFVKTSIRNDDEMFLTRTHYDDYIFQSRREIEPLANMIYDATHIYNVQCTYLKANCSLRIGLLDSMPDGDSRVTHLQDSDTVTVHARDLKYYGMVNSKIFVYVVGNIMHAISCKCYLYNSSLHAKEAIHLLPLHESEIQCMHFKENIIIESHVLDYKYIYYAFYCTSFQFSQQLVALNPQVLISDSDLALNKHQLFRQMTAFDNRSVEFPSLTDCLSNLIEELPNTTPTTQFDIEISDDEDTIAHGRGVRYAFFTNVMQEFGDLYLSRHNFVTEFNEDIASLSISELRDLGKVLALSLFNLHSHLPVRIPLALIHMIKCKPPTKTDLEIIASSEDAEALSTLSQIENDPTALEAAGIEDYYSGLKAICKLNSKYENSMREIAYGFLSYFRSRDVILMNFATMDRYISGDYHYDIESFIRQIQMRHISNDVQVLILNEIRKLSQEEFSLLLFNWSGKRAVSQDLIYEIVKNLMMSSAITFGTCHRSIVIHAQTIGEPPYKEFIEMFKPLFIERCDQMSD